MNYGELFRLLIPETILVLSVLCIIAVDLGALRGASQKRRGGAAAGVACLGCGAAFFWVCFNPGTALVGEGMLIQDAISIFTKAVLLLLAILTVLISLEGFFTEHVGEYFSLILLATVGLMFMVSTEHILMIFVSLELVSLSLYVLVAYAKERLPSAEAALKYYLFGSVASAFLLYGLSWIYGITGETTLRTMAVFLQSHSPDILLQLAMAMVVLGFGFKVAAVPFHLWAPDVYQGAPTPSAAFVASASKVGGFILFSRFFMVGFAGMDASGFRGYTDWAPLLVFTSVLSMILGNLAALAQTSVKRLLAYSAIAHAGYILIGLVANSNRGLASIIYYVVTYAITALGAFGVIAVVEKNTGGDSMSHFAGLSRRSPLLAFCMLVFMLSLAGIPPLAGFFGKFFLFAAALSAPAQIMGLLWLVVVAIAFSAVSLYYYLVVLKHIYVIDAPLESPVLRVSLRTQGLLVGIALIVILLGCLPEVMIGRLLAVIRMAAF